MCQGATKNGRRFSRNPRNKGVKRGGDSGTDCASLRKVRARGAGEAPGVTDTLEIAKKNNRGRGLAGVHRSQKAKPTLAKKNLGEDCALLVLRHKSKKVADVRGRTYVSKRQTRNRGWGASKNAQRTSPNHKRGKLPGSRQMKSEMDHLRGVHSAGLSSRKTVGMRGPF